MQRRETLADVARGPRTERVRIETARFLHCVCALLCFHVLRNAHGSLSSGRVRALENPRGYPNKDCNRHSTIVTAYYNLNGLSKHSERDYESWNARFFSLSDPMVIFTDTRSVEYIKELRSRSSHAACTKYHTQDLLTTFTANLTNWQTQFAQDPEKNIHKSYELYILWNQKTDWLAQAAAQNPFESQYFFWSDSGQFRDDSFFSTLQTDDWFWIKRPEFLPEGRLVFLSVEPFIACEILRTDDISFIDPRKVRLGAGNFGGGALAVRLWRQHYYRKLSDYLRHGKFAGKEQSIISSVCLEAPYLCYLVASDTVQGVGDKWFAMQQVLHGTELFQEYIPTVTEGDCRLDANDFN